MKTYTFNHPAAKVYQTAKSYMNTKYQAYLLTGTTVEIKDKSKNSGVGTWLENTSNLGGKDFKEKTRITIEVKSISANKSTLIMSDERMSKASGSWMKMGTFRNPMLEYYILEKIDPSAAKAMKARAEK